jgi:hypothetical protein
VVATSCVDYVLQRESELGLSALLQLHAQGAAAAGMPHTLSYADVCRRMLRASCVSARVCSCMRRVPLPRVCRIH